MGRVARVGDRITPHTWLAGVAVAFGVVQVLLVADFPLGWDEAIYASQNDPRRPALSFTAPRARGMPWLAAPLQALTGSSVALRVYLAALSSLALYAAYAVWLRVRPDGSVALAALVFGSLWTSVFYGPSLMPNVLIALAGVLATGTLLCAALGRAPAWLPWAGGAAVAATTLIRPGDAVPLLGALGLAVLAHPQWRRRVVGLLAPLVAGAAVGAVPWLVEAQLRYDGIWPRVRRALSTQGTGERFVPDYQLRAFDGPLLCRPCVREQQPIPLSGVVLWAVGLALVVLAVWVALRRTPAGESREVTLLPAWTGAVLALPYLLLVGYAAPRFLLPAYALLALPVAHALRHLVNAVAGPWRAVVAAGVAVGLLAHGTVQLSILGSIMEGSQNGRDRWLRVAEVLERHEVRPPCVLLGRESAPVAYLARCDAVVIKRYPGDEPFTLADLRGALARQSVAVVLRSGEERPAYTRGWRAVPSAELPKGWRVLVAPAAASPTPP